jgi:iron complex outermembrane receptor protein
MAAAVAASEGTSNGSTGYINGTYYLGKDLNGDGDVLDTVRLLAPSETKTHRVALTSSLRYDISHNQTVRLAYAFALGHHPVGRTGLHQQQRLAGLGV